MSREIPVFMVTGFLESGKTTFLQDTLQGEKFCQGERILCLLCEEGEVELEPEKFASKDVFIHVIENFEDLNEANLTMLLAKYKATRVLVEYNGMWLLNDFFEAMPEDWVVAQIMLFFDSSTIMSYNANMRSLVVDKLQLADFCVFNRTTDDMDTMEFHKLVRGISRQIQIAYEDTHGRVQIDEIEDPLPFDKNADVIEVEDQDFALFFRDIAEKMEDYEGKKVKFKAMVANDRKLDKGQMFVGRHIMTCCVEDIQYRAVVCKWPKSALWKDYDWVTVTGTIHVGKHKLYNGEGPILSAESVVEAIPADPKVATFY